MKLLRLLSLGLVACALPSFAQYPMTWSSFRDLALSGPEVASEVVPATGGGSYVYGAIGHYSQGLIRTDDTGAALWKRAVPGEPRNVAANSTGVVVVGALNEAWISHLEVTKYDPQGNALWTKSLPDAGPYSDSTRVAMDSAGNVVVGSTVGPTSSSDVRIVKLSAATGTDLVTKIFGGPNTIEVLRTLALDGTGSIFISGSGDPYNTFSSFIVKHDANANPLWTKTSSGRQDELLVNADGTSVISRPNGASVSVTKYDANGNVLWSTSTNEVYQGYYSCLSPSGSVYMAGQGPNGSTVGKFASSGAFAWSKAYAGIQLEPGRGHISADAADNVYVSCESSPYSQAVLLKYDTAGNFGWSKAQAGLGGKQNLGKGVFVDSSARIYWLSSIVNPAPTFTDFRLGLYDSVGNELSRNDYDFKKGNDEPIGAVTDPSGNTYVTAHPSYADVSPVRNFSVLKFSSSGAVSWQRQITPATGVKPTLFPPRLVPAGGVALLQTSILNSGVDARVYRYDASGNLVWTYSSFPGNVTVNDYAVGQDGSVYLAMSAIDDSHTHAAIRVTKLNSNGTFAWTADQPNPSFNYPIAIALHTDGTAYVSFHYTALEINYPEQVALAKFLPNGTFAWAIDCGPPAPTTIFGGLGLDVSGNPIIVVPYQDPAAYNGISYAARKFDGSGNSVYSTNLMAGLDAFGAFPVVVDSLGNLFTTSNTYVNQVGAAAVQKLGPDGSSQWIKPVPDAGSAQSLLPDGAGAVTVGATEPGDRGFDYLIYKLSPTGDPAWPASGGLFQQGLMKTDVGGLDNPLTQLTTDSSGNLFATGSAFGPSGTIDVNVAKYLSSNSEFGSQSVPTSMVAGQTYALKVTFKNTGFSNWTKAAGYKLAVINGSTFGVSSVFLNSADIIAPGQSRTFSFNVFAPTTAGAYNLQFKMYKSTSSFGSLSLVAPVTVAVRQHAARFMTQTVPTSVKAGSTFSVTVDMRNVGTNTWTAAGGYGLAPVSGYPTWGVVKASLLAADSILQGADKVFTFNCLAPGSPGSYKMRWQMSRTSVGAFGDKTVEKTITVVP